MEQALRPQEELTMIRKLMADSRGEIADDGKPSILWGMIVFLGLVYTYYEAYNPELGISGWVWMGLCVCGWIYMFGWVSQKQKRQPARTFAGRVRGAIWGAVGVSITLFIFSVMASDFFDPVVEFHPLFITYVISILLGIGYYVSGILYEIPWLRWVGIAWWATSPVYIFWPGVHSLLIFAGAELVLQVLPGILLLKKYRSAQIS